MPRITTNRIAAALFTAMLFAPLCVQVFSNTSSVSTVERRVLAPFPAFSDITTAPAGLPDKLSRWMEDHMGLRSPLTKLYAKVQDELHLEDKRFGVRGDDGWLFLAINDALASHQGLHPFAPSEAEQWLDKAASLKEAACGKPFAVLIAPDKHTIYPEKLSRYPRRSDRSTRLETLTALAPEAGIALAAPVEALKNARQVAPIYYRTDSHWTARGAFEGYRALIQMLEQEGLDLDIVDATRLEQQGTRNISGDIYGLLGVENPPAELTPDWRIKNAASIVRQESLAAYDWENITAKRWISSKDDAPRLLVYGDSFFNAMRPFMTDTFSSIAFVHHRVGNPPLSALASCDYDAVVLEMVERHLNTPLTPTP